MAAAEAGLSATAGVDRLGSSIIDVLERLSLLKGGWPATGLRLVGERPPLSDWRCGENTGGGTQ